MKSVQERQDLQVKLYAEKSELMSKRDDQTEVVDAATRIVESKLFHDNPKDFSNDERLVIRALNDERLFSDLNEEGYIDSELRSDRYKDKRIKLIKQISAIDLEMRLGGEEQSNERSIKENRKALNSQISAMEHEVEREVQPVKKQIVVNEKLREEFNSCFSQKSKFSTLAEKDKDKLFTLYCGSPKEVKDLLKFLCDGNHGNFKTEGFFNYVEKAAFSVANDPQALEFKEIQEIVRNTVTVDKGLISTKISFKASEFVNEFTKKALLNDKDLLKLAPQVSTADSLPVRNGSVDTTALSRSLSSKKRLEPVAASPTSPNPPSPVLPSQDSRRELSPIPTDEGVHVKHVRDGRKVDKTPTHNV